MRNIESWISPLLEDLRAQKLERLLTIYPEVEQRSNSDAASLINLSSNDYLNLSRHPDVLAAAGSIGRLGAGASRLVTGTLPCHAELEAALALHHGYPNSLLFGAGYLANLAVLSVVVRRKDVVISDRLVHASLIDGIVLSQAKHQRYRHIDPDHLEQLLSKLSQTRSADTRFLIVTESVFSMDGDTAPLFEICELAEKYDAMLLVDEAHALGVFGVCGQGLVHQLGLSEKVQFVTGTLSKAYGSYGGFILSSDAVKQLLVNRARPFIYNTALPPCVVKGAHAALEHIQRNKGLGEELLMRAKGFRDRLRGSGLNVMNSETQIVPLLVGDNELALELSERLKSCGVLSIAMREPTVPRETARLRFSVTLSSTVQDLRRAADIIINQAKELGLT